jgi:hypothetical protein
MSETPLPDADQLEERLLKEKAGCNCAVELCRRYVANNKRRSACGAGTLNLLIIRYTGTSFLINDDGLLYSLNQMMLNH